MTKLLDAVKIAMAKGVKVPTLRFVGFKIYKAAWKEVLYVTDNAKYPDSRYFGAIRLLDGVFLPKADCPLEVKVEVEKALESMEESMQVYGRVTGNCCICGRMLTDKESIRLMIGPICEEKWGFFSDRISGEARNSSLKGPKAKDSKIKDISPDSFDFEGL